MASIFLPLPFSSPLAEGSGAGGGSEMVKRVEPQVLCSCAGCLLLGGRQKLPALKRSAPAESPRRCLPYKTTKRVAAAE